MRDNLARAANQFGVAVHGTPVWGWCLRSISSAATGPAGRCWLRVGTERDSDLVDPDTIDFWTGIPTSTLVVGVPKPSVLDSAEWAVPDQRRQVRADLMTWIPGQPCSPTDALRSDPGLPDSWWPALRRALAAISQTPTSRYTRRSSHGSSRVRKVFGDAVADAVATPCRATAHGDLHWNNLLGPDLHIMDWELWGSAPVGYDAATLYTFALLVPDVAARVRDEFGDVLDSPDCLAARLSAASRVLWRAEDGENTDLADAVRRDVAPLLASS
jgi:hypothetical protein